MFTMVKRAKTNMICKIMRVQAVLHNKKAEGFVDSGVKILIAVVIGALLLTGLYALFGETIMPTLKTKIQDLFSYTGAAS